MIKKYMFVCLIFLLGSLFYGETLTRAAVIDLEKIMMVFYQESEPVRELELFRDELQDEINNMSVEINSLKDAKVKAMSDKNNVEVERLEEMISYKAQSFRSFFDSKQRQLKEMKENLTSNSEFYITLLNHVKFIAQSEGYTYVMKNTDPDLFWSSPEIDITDLVIERITNRN